MRRLAPRPLAAALAGLTRAAEPGTPLARVQTVWPELVGAEIAARAAPVAERDGVVTIACESAIWAQELELQGPMVLQRLAERLDAPPERLRFVTGSVPN